MNKKVDRIVSGDCITVIVDGEPTLFNCGTVDNKRFKEFMILCDDPEQWRRAVEPPIRNYIMNYGQFPPDGTTLLPNGLKPQYMATNQDDETPVLIQENNSYTMKRAVGYDKVKEYAKLVDLPTEDAAIEHFKKNSGDDSDPHYVFTYCPESLLIYKTKILESGQITDNIKQELINV